MNRKNIFEGHKEERIENDIEKTGKKKNQNWKIVMNRYRQIWNSEKIISLNGLFLNYSMDRKYFATFVLFMKINLTNLYFIWNLDCKWVKLWKI